MARRRRGATVSKITSPPEELVRVGVDEVLLDVLQQLGDEVTRRLPSGLDNLPSSEDLEELRTEVRAIASSTANTKQHAEIERRLTAIEQATTSNRKLLEQLLGLIENRSRAQQAAPK